jgi:hypothetical protein
MSKHIDINCAGRSVDDVMREATQKRDNWIAEILQGDELDLLAHGCSPREIADKMQAHRQRCMAIRDARLAAMRRELIEFLRT